MNTQNKIANLLYNSINSLQNNDKYIVKLEDKTINLINEILNDNPNFFDSIESTFNEILSLNFIKDDKINLEILNITKIYQCITKILDSINNLHCINIDFDIKINFIKFIFNLLIEENKENIQNNEIILSKIIQLIDNISNIIKIFQ